MQGSFFFSLRSVVGSATRVLVTGPVGPDGDSIGACLVLASMLESVCDAQIDVAGCPAPRYSELPTVSRMVADDQIRGPYDVAIVLDGDQSRLDGSVAAAFGAAGTRVVIDHHRSTRGDGYDLAWIDSGSASTCEMVYQLLKAWGGQLDQDLATLIYAGVIFDTGGFRHSNTRPSTHRLAAELLEAGVEADRVNTRILAERRRSGLRLMGAVLDTAIFSEDGAIAIGVASQKVLQGVGASFDDIEGIVDHLIYTEGVEVGVLCVERGNDIVKMSFRSRGLIDVAAVANTLHPTGGGHARASGVVLEGPVETVVDRVMKAVGLALTQARAA